jgi:hypothetical protein
LSLDPGLVLLLPSWVLLPLLYVQPQSLLHDVRELIPVDLRDNPGGYIDAAQLERLAQPLLINGYGQYLMSLLQHERGTE